MNGQGYQVSFEGEGRNFTVAAGRSLLASLVAKGIDILSVGCRNGGCGICRVQILEGLFTPMPMNRSRISAADEASGIVLACRIIPLSNLRIEPLPPAVVGRFQ